MVSLKLEHFGGKDVFKHHFLRERGRSPPLQEAHKLLGGWDLPAVTKTLALAPKQPLPTTSSIQKHRPNPNGQFWAALIARLVLTTCLVSSEALMLAEPATKIRVAVLYSRCINSHHNLKPSVLWTKPNGLKKLLRHTPASGKAQNFMEEAI